MSRRTLFDKIWAAHEVGARADLHRPAPRARGHDRRRPSRACGWRAARCAGPTARSPRPTTTCRPTARRSRRGSATSSRACRSRRSSATARSSACPIYSHRLRPPGHRARDRPGAGRHPAGHDDRLRRLPHLDARRVRRARVRHRHQRGRARARDPVPRPAQAEVDAHQLRRASSASASPPKDLILGTIGQMGADGARRPRRSSTPARRSRRSRWRAG